MQCGALIPLRGGSKGIKDKNIKLINGKPLCNYILEECLNSKKINKIWVSTDSLKIIEVVQSLSSNINIIKRPDELAQDTSSTESALLHSLDFMDTENIILLQATSPLTKASQIDDAIEIFEKSNYDSLLSVVKSEKFLWNKNNEPINYDYKNRQRRQDIDNYFVETGSFYISKKNAIKKSKCRISGHIGSYILPIENIHEIDTKEDWCIIERLIESK